MQDDRFQHSRERTILYAGAVVFAVLGYLTFTASASAAVTCGGLTPTINKSTLTTPQVIKGTVNPDIIVGGTAADTILSSGGEDIVCGGTGDDSIRTNSGDDEAYGQAGNDTIKTASGDDEAFGDVGNDTIKTASGDDVVNGGDGYDTINTASGDDEADPGNSVCCEGSDSVLTGDGSDRLTGYVTGQVDAFLGGGGDFADLGASFPFVHGDSGDDRVTTYPIGGGYGFSIGDAGSDYVSSPGGYAAGGLGDDYVFNADYCIGGDNYFPSESTPGDRFYNCGSAY